jgi:hypothetical protein
MNDIPGPLSSRLGGRIADKHAVCSGERLPEVFAYPGNGMTSKIRKIGRLDSSPHDPRASEPGKLYGVPGLDLYDLYRSSHGRAPTQSVR